MKIPIKNQEVPPTNERIVDEILAVLKNGQSFCLSGHQNPDGDVIGSQLAMARLLHRMDPRKNVSIQNAGPVPQSISFLPGIENVRNVTKVDGRFDVVIVFECSGQDRTGNIIDFKTQATHVINIDHHLHNPGFGTLNFVEPITSSTAEMIFKIYQRSGQEMGVDEAACLFAGMVADTGWFRYSNTNVQTLQIATQLLKCGLPVAVLSEKIYLSRSKTALRLLGWALSNMKLLYNDRLAVFSIPDAIFQSLGAGGDDLDDLVNYGLQVDSVQASILLKEKLNPAHIKASIRSKGDLDINQIARIFGGGGHKNASGCRLEGSLENAEKTLIQEMQRLF